MAVIGIDLGTTYSAAAHMKDERLEIIPLDGNPTLPSVISLLRSGTIVVGNKAKRNQAQAPQNTIIEVKRKMGSVVNGKPELVKLGQKDYLPQQISAYILMEIKKQAEEYLGEPVTGAVISCPAYFKDPQRQAT
jgi:molecular chaperone DnaK